MICCGRPCDTGESSKTGSEKPLKRQNTAKCQEHISLLVCLSARPPTKSRTISAKTTLWPARKITCCLILNDCRFNKRLLWLLPLDHFTHRGRKKKTQTHQRGETPSGRHLALSTNPAVRRRDRDELRRHLSAGLQLGHRGSEPKVKGGTAVSSAGRREAHLPTSIMEKPSSCQTLPLFLYLSLKTTDICRVHTSSSGSARVNDVRKHFRNPRPSVRSKQGGMPVNSRVINRTRSSGFHHR